MWLVLHSIGNHCRMALLLQLYFIVISELVKVVVLRFPIPHAEPSIIVSQCT